MTEDQDPVAVLLVCEPGSPLLAPGVCGALPPCAHRWFFTSPPAKTPWEAGWPKSGGQTALPLWWDGALVPEGFDRAVRVFTAPDDPGHVQAIPLAPSLYQVCLLGGFLVNGGFASQVVLLDRVDGRLVEREPCHVTVQ